MSLTPQLKKIKNVLITGGAGFIGSHLSETLLNEGHYVLCVDNFFTSKKENISHLLDNHRFDLIRHDITFPLYIEADEIYNLACPASPIHYQSNPAQTIKTNVHGAINMLGLAKRTGSKIFQASTSEVYGDPEISPQSESYFGRVNPIGLRACYDEGKRAAETLFFDYYRQHDVDIKVARIFNTYGPKMLTNDGRVVSNFIIQALSNKDITIYGDGSQTRSFCFIDDMVKGFIKFMSMDNTIHGPINLGNPFEIKIIDLAKIIIDMTNSRSKICKKELPDDDPKKRNPDISLAKKILNWEPKISLESGLLKTITYFENIKKNEKIDISL